MSRQCTYIEAPVRPSARRHPGDDAAAGSLAAGKVVADYYSGAATATYQLATECKFI
jgi:hypothetical protein